MTHTTTVATVHPLHSPQYKVRNVGVIGQLNAHPSNLFPCHRSNAIIPVLIRQLWHIWTNKFHEATKNWYHQKDLK